MTTGLNTITKIRLPSGTEVAFVDWTDKPVFSTCDLAHGFTLQQLDLFAYTEGEQVPSAAPAAGPATARTATKADTNAQAPGSMASTEERLIYSIKPEVFALTGVTPQQGQPFDFNAAAPATATGDPIPNPVFLGWLNLRLLLRLEISQKFYQMSGFGYYNTGFGVNGAGGTMATAANAGRTYATPGLPSQEAVRGFVVPQYMGGQEAFTVTLANPGGQAVNFGNSENGAVNDNLAAVARIRVYLEGLYKRPVS